MATTFDTVSSLYKNVLGREGSAKFPIGRAVSTAVCKALLMW